ncbi:MAG: DUF2007 domain-containing protein [Planctomycetota bacterium]|nr:DUF2007 domain-containing protein [Planctomycetota bacterium]
MAETDKYRLVVVAAAATLTEADVIRASLDAAGIDAMILNETTTNVLSHLNFAINPGGIRIAVSARDTEAARELLAHHGVHSEEADEYFTTPQEDAPAPDDYAQKAYWSAFFSWWLFPFIIITLYWFIKAAKAHRRRPAEQPGRFKRHMLIAFFVGILPALVCASACVAFLVRTGL